MGRISSLTGVILAWLGVSVGLWGLQALRTWAKRRRERKLADDACRIVDEAQTYFDGVRRSLSDDAACSGEEEEKAEEKDQRQISRDAASRMLFRLRGQSAYFDGAAALRMKILSEMKGREHPGLAEILQIRRDLWGAVEVLLAEDHREMGDAFAGESDFERCRGEAMAVVFKEAPGAGGARQNDPIDLRLFQARVAAGGFAEAVEAEIHAARERERLPTLGEVAAPPLSLARAFGRYAGAAGVYLRAVYRRSRATARKVRQSEAVARGLVRVRRLGLVARLQAIRLGRGGRRTALQCVMAGRACLVRLKRVAASSGAFAALRVTAKAAASKLSGTG